MPSSCPLTPGMMMTSGFTIFESFKPNCPRVTDPPQSPYVLDTNGIPWRRHHLASNLRNNAEDWHQAPKQEHFLEEVITVY